MGVRIGLMAAFLAGVSAGALWAEDAFVQIEARPTLDQAEERARSYAATLPDVEGFRLSSGWYGIVLGPYEPDVAALKLDLLKREGMIPADSFIATPGSLGRPFWPNGTVAEPAVTTPTPPAGVQVEPPEDPRAAEALLTEAERVDVQTALDWAGTYQGRIDGAFGKGTRLAMAAWQAREGHEATGILTPAERATVLDRWRRESAALGLTPVTEEEAGIRIDLPLGLVEFDRYQPPFVHYRAKGGSGVEVFLISRAGDGAALAALYDRVAGMAAIPVEGERKLGKSAFAISGSDPARRAWAEATLAEGRIKGFILTAPGGEGGAADRALKAMRASFTPLPGKALDPGMGEPSSVPADLMTAGLSPRRPTRSQSGMFVDARGTVLTALDGLQGCARLTIDRRHDATLTASDPALGLAILTPKAPLAPRGVAEFAASVPADGSDMALAGYPFGDQLSAPVMTYGRLTAGQGLDGSGKSLQLALTAREGDTGAALLDATGAVAGLLMPHQPGHPADAATALPAPALSAALTAQTIQPAPHAATAGLAREDLDAKARALTALVSCWN